MDRRRRGCVGRDHCRDRRTGRRPAERAAIDAATLNLGYAEIRAPFAGRLGRNLAAKGALVGPSTGALNTLVQLDPVYVAFNPSESELGEIERARAAGKVAAEISVPGD